MSLRISILSWTLVSALAQTSSMPVEVELSAATAAPGAVAVIPVLLRVPSDFLLQQVELKIMIPATAVELKRVRLAEGREETLTVEHRLGEPSQGQLPVTILISAGQPELTSGELVRLIMDVDPAAEEESHLLPIEARVWRTMEQGPERIESLDGILVINQNAGIPVFGCFFYMH